MTAKLAMNRLTRSSKPTPKSGGLWQTLCVLMKLTKSLIVIFILLCSLTANADNLWVQTKGGIWKPNEQILSNLKPRIKVYVSNEAIKQNRELMKWEEYAFQYMGLEDKDGRYILVNALCGKKNRNELENFILTSDGGSCYFSLRYKPDKKQFYGLFINGFG